MYWVHRVVTSLLPAPYKAGVDYPPLRPFSRLIQMIGFV